MTSLLYVQLFNRAAHVGLQFTAFGEVYPRHADKPSYRVKQSCMYGSQHS